jgi:probable rRNA maturation factor
VNIVLSDERDDPLSTSSPDDGELVALARRVLEGEAYPAGTEVMLTLVDPGRISELNREYLGGPGPTDVLSFPIEDLAPGVAPAWRVGGPPLVIGDVVICPEVVAERAGDYGVGIDDEMALMVVHGLLHLIGYDHQTDEDAERMEGLERLHLEAVGRTRR